MSCLNIKKTNSVVKEQNLKLLFLSIVIAGLWSCVEFPNKYSKLAPGPWRATLQLDKDPMTGLTKPLDDHSLSEIRDIKIESIVKGHLPFIMEVEYPRPDSFVVIIKNADESIRITDIRFGRSFQTAKDTLELHFPEYRSLIKATVEDRVMEGVFIDSAKINRPIAFTAQQGENYRFTEIRKDPIRDITGAWNTVFDYDTEKAFDGEAQFQQDGNHLKATFATNAGDFRYFEGTIQENKLYLSTFDGNHVYLVEGKVFEDSIIGVLYSGRNRSLLWKTYFKKSNLKDPFNIVNFDSTQQLEAQRLFEEDPLMSQEIQLKNRPVVLEIMGTWCPNCKDAGRLLDTMSQKYPDVAFIQMAYERGSLEAPHRLLKQYAKQLGLHQRPVYGGVVSKEEVLSDLPMLDALKSYPSILFFDHNHHLKRVFTGFYGPATMQYGKYRRSIDQTIQEMDSNLKKQRPME